jgi:hypothetical protein
MVKQFALALLSVTLLPLSAFASDVLPVFDTAAVIPIVREQPNLILYDGSQDGDHTAVTTTSMAKRLASSGRAPKTLSKSTIEFSNSGGDRVTATLLSNYKAVDTTSTQADAVAITLNSYRYVSNLSQLDTAKHKLEKTLLDMVNKGVVPTENAGTVGNNFHAAYRILTERDTTVNVFTWGEYQIVHPNGLRSLPDNYSVQFYTDKYGSITLGVDPAGTPYLLFRIK